MPKKQIRARSSDKTNRTNRDRNRDRNPDKIETQKTRKPGKEPKQKMFEKIDRNPHKNEHESRGQFPQAERHGRAQRATNQRDNQSRRNFRDTLISNHDFDATKRETSSEKRSSRLSKNNRSTSMRWFLDNSQCAYHETFQSHLHAAPGKLPSGGTFRSDQQPGPQAPS